MKKSTKKWVMGIALAALIIGGILAIPNTGITFRKAVLHYEGTAIELPVEEALLMRMIFSFKLYDPGIGGCPFEEDVSISFGDTVYAIALDGCHCAKDWNKEKYIELNNLEYQQIAALLKKYCGDTPIY